MSRPAGEPLTPISIRLPTADLKVLKECYPQGYQTKIKELVHELCEQLRDWQRSGS